MGRVWFESGGGIKGSPNTKCEFEREAALEDVKRALQTISQASALLADMSCFVVGMGAQPKSAYEGLKRNSALEVISTRSALPSILQFASGLIASHEGIIKILDTGALMPTFLQLLHQSMAAVYCFSKGYDKAFIQAWSAKSIKSYDFGVKEDPRYLIYMVDADNQDSPTGIVEIISYGVDAPPDLIPL